MIKRVYPYTLRLKMPFGISGLSRSSTPVVYVMLEQDGEYGIGEASLPPYLPETSQTVIDFVREFEIAGHQISERDRFFDSLHSTTGQYAAKAALETAFLDLSGKLLKKPLYELLGCSKDLPQNTYTVGIGDLSAIPDKLNDGKDFNIIKVKLGAEDDREIIRAIRSHTDKPLCADVNQGWRDLELASELCTFLKAENILFIEQPFQKQNIQDHKALRERCSLDLYADESIQGIDDLLNCHEAFDGINVKLMKCGGPSRAMQLIAKARDLKKKVLLGSMNESSCANLAAAHISGLADMTDLDGPFLISNNPFEDPVMRKGCIDLPQRPGLGLQIRQEFANFKEMFNQI